MLALPCLTELSGLKVKFEPDNITPPVACPYQDCHHPHLRLHQIVAKRLRDFDPAYSQLTSYRYQCRRCKRTLRVYPEGVAQGQASPRVKNLAVTLYCLGGLSYQGVSLALKELGVIFSKSWVYQTVQAVAERLRGLDPIDKNKDKECDKSVAERPPNPFPKVATLAVELVKVKAVGCRELLLGITLEAQSGEILTIDQLQGQDGNTLKTWLEPIVKAAEVETLVTGTRGAFASVVEEAGLVWQLDHEQVARSIQARLDRIKTELEAEPAKNQSEDRDNYGANNTRSSNEPLASTSIATLPSLAEIGLSQQQAVCHLAQLEELIWQPHSEMSQQTEIQARHERYLRARPPLKGEQATVAYRLRMLFLDCWNKWPCFFQKTELLTSQKHRQVGGLGQDGNNSELELAYQWSDQLPETAFGVVKWLKTKFRQMRGFKCAKVVAKISRLLVAMWRREVR